MENNPIIRRLRPADFESLTGQSSAPALVRPSRSYWQDAWGRLKANKRAIVSLFIIIGLLIFTFVGPLVWRVNPSLQDIDQISIAPGADRRAVIVEPFVTWDGISGVDSSSGADLWLAEDPTTQSVRLKWRTVPGAEGYRIYRNIYQPEDEFSLGLPLITINNSALNYYEDRLDLTPQT